MFFIVDKKLRPRDGEDTFAWVIWSLLEGQKNKNTRDDVSRLVVSSVDYLEDSICRNHVKFITTSTLRICIATIDDFIIGLGCSKYFSNAQVDRKLQTILDIFCFFYGSFDRIRQGTVGPGPEYERNSEFKEKFFPKDYKCCNESGEAMETSGEIDLETRPAIGHFFERYVSERWVTSPGTVLNMKFIPQHSEKDVVLLTHQILRNLISRSMVHGVAVFFKGKIILSTMPNQLTSNIQYLIEQKIAIIEDEDSQQNLELPKLFIEGKSTITPEELQCRNLREVYLTEEQYAVCLKTSTSSAQNEHLSNSFRPRDFRHISIKRGGSILSEAATSTIFANRSTSPSLKAVPAQEWGRIPLYLHDKGDIDIAVCTLLQKVPLCQLDTVLRLINSLLSKVKSQFDDMFLNKSILSNAKVQEHAATVINMLERKPEFEVLRTLNMKNESSNSSKNSTQPNIRSDRMFGVDLSTGSMNGHEDFEQTSEESRRTFALAHGILEQHGELYPGYPTEMHLKSAKSYQSVSTMGGHAVFFEHVFGMNTVQDNSLPAVILRMEKLSLDLARYKSDKSNSQ